jgi:hypothetical protein
VTKHFRTPCHCQLIPPSDLVPPPRDVYSPNIDAAFAWRQRATCVIVMYDDAR